MAEGTPVKSLQEAISALFAGFGLGIVFASVMLIIMVSTRGTNNLDNHLGVSDILKNDGTKDKQ